MIALNVKSLALVIAVIEGPSSPVNPLVIGLPAAVKYFLVNSTILKLPPCATSSANASSINPISRRHLVWPVVYVPAVSSGNSVRLPLVRVVSTMSCKVVIAACTSEQLSVPLLDVLAPAVP